MNYVFTKEIPMPLLFELLEPLCVIYDTQHIVDENVYKKMIFTGAHVPFLKRLKEYYHKSKHNYLTREFTYKSFTNILRQICRSHKHPFYTKMQYNHSNYTILYFIRKDLKNQVYCVE